MMLLISRCWWKFTPLVSWLVWQTIKAYTCWSHTNKLILGFGTWHFERHFESLPSARAHSYMLLPSANLFQKEDTNVVSLDLFTCLLEGMNIWAENCSIAHSSTSMKRSFSYRILLGGESANCLATFYITSNRPGYYPRRNDLPVGHRPSHWPSCVHPHLHLHWWSCHHCLLEERWHNAQW